MAPRVAALLLLTALGGLSAAGKGPPRQRFHHLADRNTFVPEMKRLYEQFGTELREMHAQMRPWCDETRSCKFCDREAEMLYMLVRLWRPTNMFEMAPNRGYSTSWILKAMQHNEHGTLHSFDIHRSAAKFVDRGLQARWNFTVADVRALAAADTGLMAQYDFIFIDALHLKEFSLWYTRTLLSHQVVQTTPVVIHDIVATVDGSGRESEPVYQFLAFSDDVTDTFTLAGEGLTPTPVRPVAAALREVDTFRAAQGISGAQKYFSCARDPSIFFLKRAPRNETP